MNTVKSKILPKVQWLQLSEFTRSQNNFELYQVLEGQTEQI